MEKSTGNRKTQEREINFQWFIVTFLVHWKWFLLSIVSFLLGGYLYLRYATPIYQVASSIILKDSKRGGLGNSELSVFENMGILENNSNVDNEMEILRSRNLIEAVVIEQELYIRYVIKGKFKDTELYNGSYTKFYTSTPVKVFADAKIISALNGTIYLNVSLTDKSTIRVIGHYGGREFMSEYSSLPAVLKTPIGEVLLLSDEKFLLKKEYPLDIQIIPPLWMAQRYMGALRLNLTDKNTTVVQLLLKETHTKRGEDFLSKLVELYNRDAMDDKNKAATNASRFISDRLIGLTDELIISEKSIEDYRKKNRITSLDVESEMLMKEDNEYEKKLVQNGTEKLLLSYLEEELNNDNSSLLPATLGGINPSLSSGIENYNRTLLERERLLAYTSDESPVVIRVDERLNMLKEDIRAGIKALKYTLTRQEEEYAKMNKYYGGDIEDVPRRERELTELVRQQMIKANLYVDLLKRREEIDLTLAVTAPRAKVLESPLASGPIAPRRSMIYLMCLAGGFLFPFFISGFREMLNYKLSDEEEVRRLSEVPIIVSLPYVRSNDALVVTPTATTAIVERFRLLRTNLQFTLDNVDKKSILVTSTISGEGKTFVSINLAMIFSLKYKTLLVGLDIRRPKITDHLGLPKQLGLISYLTGEETDVNKLINRNVKGTNLDALVSGVVPPNPNELLIERTLDKMFADLRKQYDYIIIDSSPVGSVSDAFLLSRVSDASLFVVRKDWTPKSAIFLVNNINEEKRLNNVNLVLNAFNSGKGGRYGYGYGYGYGSEEK